MLIGDATAPGTSTVSPEPTVLPSPRTPAQAEAARLNGSRSQGPATAAGKARAALNGTRHGLCSAEFFLLADEDPEAYAAFSADMLGSLRPRDATEQRVAILAVQAMWRQMRADRLEADIMGELFAARRIEDPELAAATSERAMKALGTLLRYRSRLEREHDRAMQELGALRQGTPVRTTAPARPSEPGRQPPAAPRQPEAEPERQLNRHERRRLAALQRQGAARAA